jgi:CSLREA domain-containing protein
MVRSRVLGVLPWMLVVMLLVALAAASVAEASSTVTDLGAGVRPVAVNVKDQVLLDRAGVFAGVWTPGGTILGPPPAPSGDPTATFTTPFSQSLSDSGVVVGSALTGSGATVPAYWNSAAGGSFVEISLAGLMVNGQPVSSGQLDAIDAGGDAVGQVCNANANSTGNCAGLLVGGSGGLPTGGPQLVTNLGGTSIYSLMGISANYELGIGSGANFPYNVLYNQMNGIATTTDDYEHEYIGDDAGSALGTDGATDGWRDSENGPVVRLVSGTESALQPLTGTTAWASIYDQVEAINSSATTVGSYSISDTDEQATDAVRWDQSGNLTNLNTQLGQESGWVLTDADAINATGDIAGVGTLDGDSHGYLLTSAAIVPPVVNSTGDAPAENAGANGCNTGNTVTVGGQPVPECTLRAAIQAENTGSVTEKSITFALPASANGLIQPATALPALTAAEVTIDATPGTVTLDGKDVAGTTVGLELSGAGENVNGLVLQDWSTAIKVDSAGGGDVFTRNVIAPNGASVQTGIDVEGSPNNEIGGTTAGEGNTLEQTSVGILINGAAATGNSIQGNLIGTDPSGNVFEGSRVGITIINASGSTVGGTTSTPGATPGNVIDGSAGATTAGIIVGGISSTVTATTIEGNVIGLLADGSDPNTVAAGYSYGVQVLGLVSGTSIGGSSAGDGNVITGASQTEVLLDGTSVTGTQVLGNLIGTNPTGLAAPAPNGSPGGVLVAGASHTTIGTPGAGANVITAQESGGIAVVQKAISASDTLLSPPVAYPGTNQTATSAMSTLISGNMIGPLTDGNTPPSVTYQAYGVKLAGIGDTLGPNNEISYNGDGVDVGGSNETVVGNQIGTNASGVTALPNGTGINVYGTGAQIGLPGLKPNTISGNLNDLILTAKATVQNNLIGTTALGNAPIGAFTGTLPAGLAGTYSNQVAVYTLAGAAGSLIGGTLPGYGNVISGNASDGLDLDAAVVVQGNKIGVGTNGSTAVPNTGDGINIDQPGTLGAIFPGGTGLTAGPGGNIIANNGKAGIEVEAGTSPVAMLSDSIYANAGGGIVLDSEANAGIAPPSLLQASQDGDGNTNVQAHVAAGSVQVFVADSCTDTTAQGKTLLSTFTVTSAGAVNIVLPLQPVGTEITATITPTTGTSASALTSQFSRCVTVTAAPTTPSSTTPAITPSTASSVELTSDSATTGSASVTLPVTVNCSSATDTPCTITTTATLPAATTTGKARVHTIPAAKHKKAKTPTKIGGGTLRLAAGATGRLKLHITTAGLALLRSRHTLVATLAIKITGSGRATITHNLRIRLAYKKAAKTRAKDVR